MFHNNPLFIWKHNKKLLHITMCKQEMGIQRRITQEIYIIAKKLWLGSGSVEVKGLQREYDSEWLTGVISAVEKRGIRKMRKIET